MIKKIFISVAIGLILAGCSNTFFKDTIGPRPTLTEMKMAVIESKQRFNYPDNYLQVEISRSAFADYLHPFSTPAWLFCIQFKVKEPDSGYVSYMPYFIGLQRTGVVGVEPQDDICNRGKFTYVPFPEFGGNG